MSSISSLESKRNFIRNHYLFDEKLSVQKLLEDLDMADTGRQEVAEDGAELVAKVRATTKPGLMESFLAEYGLSTSEGVALMCLAEALLRVPDSQTIDDLISDKIAEGGWKEHLGQSNSGIVNFSSYGLYMASGMIGSDPNVKTTLQGLVKRIGMPAVRTGARLFMKELGYQFVLGQDIDSALERAAKELEYRYSFDMLGEAAKTAEDAEGYYYSYQHAIERIETDCKKASSDGSKVRAADNPGISIKLSALHPRYEWIQRDRVLAELTPKVLALALKAKAANMGLTIDAEEADRLELSLDIIEAVFMHPDLADWEGFGVVVQAYGKRAPYVLDYLYELAEQANRNLMVRLVKGAYWDTEIKQAQVLGIKDYPVYTRKPHSDISYASCVRKLHGMRDRIFPQFATHNAHTIAMVQKIFENDDSASYEFQRLHGMGESLYSVLRRDTDIQCRVYAPVGVHRDLLAYLVRRLLENGANSSFVNQLYDEAIPPEHITTDPVLLAQQPVKQNIDLPEHIFMPERQNAKGWDVTDVCQMEALASETEQFEEKQWHAGPVVAFEPDLQNTPVHVFNPADDTDIVGTVRVGTPEDINKAYSAAAIGFETWSKTLKSERASLFNTAADLFEQNAPEFFTLLCREAGKTLPDAISEVREAVDFLRYYAVQGTNLEFSRKPRGVIACISPWNFPLAIFAGQITAALAAGNTVIAKPAGQTRLVAVMAVKLMHQAGIPVDALQIVPGSGRTVGQALMSHPDVAGVCFTGSTATAQHINRTLGEATEHVVPLVAETGGLNAMIVDSTALPEQAIRDIVASAFQSAGQRCSALRLLYVQEDIKDHFLTMLYGAVDELLLGNPKHLATDVGPVIDHAAQRDILAYIQERTEQGKLLKTVPAPDKGLFVPPTILSVNGIADMEREVFGPVLHVATYRANELGQVVDDINASGYGLTLGMHSRIDDRTAFVQRNAHVGNIYINRNQIGAVVGSQPFGGENLSGTGPKAGGPHYLHVFTRNFSGLKDQGLRVVSDGTRSNEVNTISLECIDEHLSSLACSAQEETKNDIGRLAFELAHLLPDLRRDIEGMYQCLTEMYPDMYVMPGPVGETNHLSLAPRGIVVCLGPDMRAMVMQLLQSLYFGNRTLVVTSDERIQKVIQGMSWVVGFVALYGDVEPAVWQALNDVDAVAFSGDVFVAKSIQKALSEREGAILPLIDEVVMPYRYFCERHVCTDVTASGGNVTLLAAG